MLTRRSLIYTSIQLALAGSLLAFLPACSQQDETHVQIENSELVELLLSYSLVSYAGPKCTEALGLKSPSGSGELQQSLADALEAKLSSLANNADITQRLEQLMRNDFAASNTMDIDGWQLSQTECQVSALAASLQGYTVAVEAELTPPVEIDFANVEAWGPDRTVQGEPFNEQPDGHSGIWVKAASLPPSTVLVFADKQQESNVYEEHMTSGLRGKFMHSTINKPGVYSVDLYDRSKHRIQRIGEFEVVARTTPVPFYKCRIADWGPKNSTAGVPFNEQPDGASAFWIRTNCTNHNAKIVVDGQGLRTKVRPADGLITAHMPGGHELSPGEHKVELHIGDDGNILEVGSITLKQPSTP